MTEYLAVFKLKGDSTPTKTVVEANSVIRALAEMCDSAGVPDTSSMDSYELLEITDSGKAYIPVASKDSPEVREQRLKRRAFKESTSTALTVVPPSPPVSTEEADYEPYQVEEAA